MADKLTLTGDPNITSPAEASMRVPPGMWRATHTPAAAAQATISRAAGAAGVKHVCWGVIISIAAAGTAQTPLAIHLRDGATGAGTILATWKVSAVANTGQTISVTGLNIPGTAATAMTLETAAVTATAVEGTVTLIGYDTI